MDNHPTVIEDRPRATGQSSTASVEFPGVTRPRLVATDLDGTLLRSDQSVSARTARLLDRLVADGVRVVLVTGRPVRWMRAVYEQLATPVPAVCANGAVVYDPVTDRVLRADPLTPDLLAEVVRRLRAEIPGISLAVEITNGWEMWHEVGYPVHLEDDVAVRMVDAPEELLTNPAVKLLARGRGQDPEAFVKMVAAAVEGLAEATHSTLNGMVEISAAGVTKAAGLAWLCSGYGVSADEVIAFGDMPNDLPMLTWAGQAVAVANAHPTVLEVADAVTGSNDEDGLASHLERLFPASADRVRPRPGVPAEH
jgi:Cof subfamily protein (haloacid dehalogenase superfamily)